MKILTAFIKAILGTAFIAFCAVVTTFFITIFYPSGVLNAVEIFRSLTW